MSFLDLDEWLIDLAARVEVVYSPIMDVKEYPHRVDLALVEGAVANQDHLEQIRLIRQRTRILVAFGDCAVTGNVTALRNPLGAAAPVLERAYLDGANLHPRQPACAGIVPPLLDRVRPIHEVVPVEAHLPGCPPPAPRIRVLLEQVLAGQPPRLEGAHLRFG
jgi:NAD-reducing hydrogenase small subunit